MNNEPLNGLEIARQETNIILSRQAEFLSNALCQNASEAEIFQRGVTLELVNASDQYCMFPAVISANRDETRFAFQFDLPTFDYLVDTFSEEYQVTPSEIAEMYISTGVASFLLMGRVREQRPSRVERMLNLLTDCSVLCDSIRTSDVLPESQRNDAIQSLMQSDSRRIGNINVLRFAFSMLYMEPENFSETEITEDSSRQNRLMRLFQAGLKESIRSKPKYQQLGEIFRHNVSTAGHLTDMTGDKVFADSIAEFEFAACFPMDWKELRSLLSICK